jgi:hypothetical protein
MSNTFLNYIFKSGLKRSRKMDLFNAFNYFFFVFFNKTLSWEGLDHQINILKHSFFKNTNYFDINYVLFWLSNFLNPVFEVVCYAVPKQYKKKLKKNHLFKLKYNYTPSRKKIALKWLHIYSNDFNDRSLPKRLLKSLFYTFVQGRESFLHKKKIQIYGKFLKKNNQI